MLILLKITSMAGKWWCTLCQVLAKSPGLRLFFGPVHRLPTSMRVTPEPSPSIHGKKLIKVHCQYAHLKLVNSFLMIGLTVCVCVCCTALHMVSRYTNVDRVHVISFLYYRK